MGSCLIFLGNGGGDGFEFYGFFIPYRGGGTEVKKYISRYVKKTPCYYSKRYIYLYTLHESLSWLVGDFFFFFGPREEILGLPSHGGMR